MIFAISLITFHCTCANKCTFIPNKFLIQDYSDLKQIKNPSLFRFTNKNTQYSQYFYDAWDNASKLYPQINFVELKCSKDIEICSKYKNITTPLYVLAPTGESGFVNSLIFREDEIIENPLEKFINTIKNYFKIYPLLYPVNILRPDTSNIFYRNTINPIFVFYESNCSEQIPFLNLWLKRANEEFQNYAKIGLIDCSKYPSECKKWNDNYKFGTPSSLIYSSQTGNYEIINDEIIKNQIDLFRSNLYTNQKIETKDNRQNICGNNLTYDFNGTTKTLTISGTGKMSFFRDEYDIPWNYFRDNINTVILEEGVTTISTNAFKGYSRIVNISFPSTLQIIYSGAFKNCNNIVSITLPSNLEEIYESAFEWCNSLTSVYIPSSVTYIGNCSFSSCKKLRSIDVDPNNRKYMSENGVLFSKNHEFLIIYPGGKNDTTEYYDYKSIYICKYAFAYNNYINSVYFQVANSFGNGSFYYCEELQSVVIIAPMIRVEYEAFKYCSKLHSFIYASEDQAYYVRDNAFWMNDLTGICLNKKSISTHFGSFKRVFKYIDYGSAGSLVTWIYNSGSMSLSFYGNGYIYNYSSSSRPLYLTNYEYQIKTIQIFNGITQIGDYAFRNLQNVTSISMPETINYIGSRAFFNCNRLTNINITDNVKFIGSYAFSNCTSLISFNSPKNLVSFENGLLQYCENLISIDISESVKAIEIDSLFYCSNLQSISVNENNKHFLVENNVLYTIDKNLLAFYLPYKNDTSFIVPSEVTEIGPYAFSKSKLDSITISDNVTTIGKFAFYDSAISKVVLPNNLSIIKEGTFSCCINLSSINIPNNLSIIEDESFYLCAIDTLTIPNNVTSIGNSSFKNCYNLLSIQFNDKLTIIGDYAFESCNISSLDFPDSLVSIGNSSFKNCQKINSIKFGKGLKTINDYAFAYCIINSVTFPDNLVSIGNYSFRNCFNLSSIEFNDGLELIGNLAFTQCNVSSLVFPESVISIGTYCFKNCRRLASINLNSNLQEISDDCFHSSNITTLKIPDNIKRIGKSSFMSCSQLSSIEFGEGVEIIDDSAFSYCKSLTSIIFPDKLEIIGNRSFYYCPDLSMIKFNNIVHKIGDFAFHQNDISSLYLPDSIVSLGKYSFDHCSQLEDIHLSKNIEYIGDYSFSYCKMKSFIIPEKTTNISKGMFMYCNYLEKVIIHDNITSIGQDSLAYTSITSFIIPEKVTFIGENAFKKSMIDFMHVPNNVRNIGKGAFYQCINLVSVIIGNNVTIINSNVFSECTNLTSIVFCGNISKIDNLAFSQSTNIKSITYLGLTNPRYDTNSFVSVVSVDVQVRKDYSYKYFGKLDVQNSIRFGSDSEKNIYWIANEISKSLLIYGNKEMSNYSSNKKPAWNLFESSIKNVTIFRGVKSIGDESFAQFTNLASAYISDTVKFIGEKAFYSCSMLSNITVDNKNKYLKEIDNVVYSNDVTTLILYPPGNNKEVFSFPKSVTLIKNYAFNNNHHLSIFEYPNKEEINYENNSIIECPNLNLTHVLFDYQNDFFINISILKCVKSGDCGDNLYWVLNQNLNSLSIYGYGDMYNYSSSNKAPWYSDKLYVKNLILSTEITSIGDEAFLECSNILSINLNNNIKYIGNFSFSRCKSIKHVLIPDNATLGTGSFSFCSGVISFNITKNNKNYKEKSGILFSYNEKSLIYYPSKRHEYYSHYVIPDIVTSIEDYAFSGINQRFGVLFNSNLKTIGKYAFSESCIKDITLSYVKYVSEYAFAGCIYLTNIQLTESVTSIRDYAFSECNISKIDLINVTYVGKYAFYRCDRLNNIIFNYKYSIIDEHAFDSTGIGKLNFLNAKTNITLGPYSFANCNKLKSVYFKRIEAIDSYAFKDCVNLTSFIYNNTIDPVIGTNIISGCIQLKTIEVPLNYENETFGNYTVEKNFAFGEFGSFRWELEKRSKTLTIFGSGYMPHFSSTYIPKWTPYIPLIENVVIKKGASTLGRETFKNCINLQSVTLPSSLTYIYAKSFMGCINLTYFYIYPQLRDIEYGAFAYSGLKTLNISKENGYFYLENGILYTNRNSTLVFCFPSMNETSLVIPKKVTTIYGYAFSCCNSLISVDIKGANKIGEYAFSNCSNLKTVIFDLKKVDGNSTAFYGCINLKPIYVRLNYYDDTFCGEPVLKSYDDGTYGSCQYLLNALNGSLIIYGSGYMYDNGNKKWEDFRSNITNVIVSNGITNIYQNTFSYLPNLEYADIPDSVTEINEHAFSNCKSLKSFYIPKNIVKIEYGAFSQCINLTKFVVDPNNTVYSTIDGVLVANGNQIICYPEGIRNESYILPKNITSIYREAFSRCQYLLSVNSSNTLYNIDENAFYQCFNLYLVSIFDINGKINSRAFYRCYQLEKFYYYGLSCPDYTSTVFSECSRLETIYVNDKYNGNEFCGLPVQRISNELSSSADIDSSITSFEDTISISTNDFIDIDSSYNIETSNNKESLVNSEDISSLISKPNDSLYSSEQEEETIQSSESKTSSHNINTPTSVVTTPTSVITTPTSVITTPTSVITAPTHAVTTPTHDVTTPSSNFPSTDSTTQSMPDIITPLPSLPPISEIISIIEISDDLGFEELDKKLNDEFEKMKQHGNNTNNVIIFDSNKLEFNSNLENNQYIKPFRNDSKIDYKGGNLNLILPKSDIVSINVNDEKANISIIGEGELHITNSNMMSKSINIKSNSRLNGTVNLIIPNEIDSLTIDYIKFEKESSFTAKTKDDNRNANISVKTIETSRNANAKLENLTILNSVTIVQSSTLNINNVTLDKAVFYLDIFDLEVQQNEWSPFFKGNFSNPPNKIIINKIENAHEMNPNANKDYTLLTGWFEENKCPDWLDKIELGSSGFNKKNCIANEQILSPENQRIIIQNQSNNNGNNKKKLSGGQIAGIVIGCVAGVAIIITVVILVIKCRNKNRDSDDSSGNNQNNLDL